MEYKSFPAVTKAIDDRTVIGLAALFGNVDSGNDRIWKGAFLKTIQERGLRVRHLWQHQFGAPPTATIKELREVGRGDLPDDLKKDHPELKGGLEVTREYLPTPRGDEILAALKSEPPAITEMSFGYDPVKYDFEEIKGKDDEHRGVLIRNLRELRLWDTSDVNWGMNALTVASKVVVPFRDTGTSDEGTSWSRPRLQDFTEEGWDDLSGGERRRIAAHFAWSEVMPPESFENLKLPHHQAGDTGVGPAIWRGVSAAMGALLGARGGVEIPGSDRRGVYNHLASHYRQYDKEVPDFKLVELAAAVSDLFEGDAPREDLGAVSMLRDHEVEWLIKAFATLQEMFTSAEPVKPVQVRLLTEATLKRLEIAERFSITLTR